MRVGQGDVLVVDEASQVSTADLARIVNLAYRAGARVILTGDTEQLGPVEAGGMFRLIAAEGERYQLAEVRRFDEGWERKASLQLRAGELAAWDRYWTYGRVYDGPQDRVHDRAVDLWLTDTAAGQDLAAAGRHQRGGRAAGRAGPAAADRARADPRRPGHHPERREPRQPGRPGPGPAQHRHRRRRAAAGQPRRHPHHRLDRRRRGPGGHRPAAADRARPRRPPVVG